MTVRRGNRSPAFWVSLLAVIGILGGEYAAGLGLSPRALCAALTTLAALAALVPRFQKSPTVIHSIILGLLCITIGATKITVDRGRTFVPSDTLFHRDEVLMGMIQEPPTVIGNRTKFNLAADLHMERGGPGRFPAAILVSVQPTRKDSAPLRLEYGMTVALRGRLARPVAGRNPGEFNERQYYEANGISLLMFVHGYAQVKILDSSGGWWFMRRVVVPARRGMLRIIDETVGAEEGEFLKGLLIGERSGISQEMREAFVNSGVAHILAVSGSNVAVVAAFLFALLEFLRLPKRVRVSIVAVGLLFYMMLTGNQPPVVRATIMALVFLLAGILQARSNVYNALGVSALIILGIDARQLFDVGFQLSFAAVLSIIYLYPKANDWISVVGDRTVWHRAAIWLVRLCAVSLVATLGTLPMTAIYFGKVSLIGVFANMVVIPATSASVVLGFVSILAGTMSSWIADVYARANTILLHWTLVVTNIAGSAPFATLDTVRFTLMDALPYYAALAVVFHSSEAAVSRKLLILLLVTFNIAVFLPSISPSESLKGKLRISFIDVGEGDAALVEFPRGKIVLIDAGPRAWNYDAGKRNVAPFLRRRGISAIDMLIITHLHDDHLGGAPIILKQFEVRQVVDNGQPDRSPIVDEYIRNREASQSAVETARAGICLDVEPGVRLYVLHPAPGFIERDTLHQEAKLNAGSLVLKLQYGSTGILFAGDAELEAEARLVSVYGDFLHSTVLKAGHHGSATSNSQEFLEAVRPEHAVISAGRNNKFRHPSERVVERFEQMGVHLIRTDDDGAAIFESDGNRLEQIRWH